MSKPKFPLPLSLFHHSPERPERIKGVNTVVPPKLDSLDLMAIVDRANKVNGRPYNIWYIDKIITDMYPRIANFATPTSQKAPNPTPIRSTSENVASTVPQTAIRATPPAPEVAPPPMITSDYAPNASVQAPEQYPNTGQVLKRANQVNQELPQNIPALSEAQEKQAYVEASRLKVLQSYADGEAASNSTQEVIRQAEQFANQSPVQSSSPDDYDRTKYGLAS